MKCRGGTDAALFYTALLRLLTLSAVAVAV